MIRRQKRLSKFQSKEEFLIAKNFDFLISILLLKNNVLLIQILFMKTNLSLLRIKLQTAHSPTVQSIITAFAQNVRID